MPLVGLDINSTRILAVNGPAGSWPRPMSIGGTQAELPMALSLHGACPEVGRAGLKLCRRAPHLACVNFLPQVGGPAQWGTGPKRLDAADALTRVFKLIQEACTEEEALVMCVPSYLEPVQAGLVRALASAAGLPVLGSLAAPLAVALAAYTDLPWAGLAVALDVDDHALTCSVIDVNDKEAVIKQEHSFPQWNSRAWKEKLLDAVSNLCVRHSRRDPRYSAQAEQMLYDQLDGAQTANRDAQMVEFIIQGDNWFQNLIVQAEEVKGFCSLLARQAADGIRAFLTSNNVTRPIRVLLATESAARLPGMVEALQSGFGKQTRTTIAQPEAAALATHDLANRLLQGSLEKGHYGSKVPFYKIHQALTLGRIHQRVIPLRTAER